MLNFERWRDIPNYEGKYKISSWGNVKSIKKTGIKYLKPFYARKYQVVRLYKDGLKQDFYIHKLVAIVFLGHEPCGMSEVVDHIDNNQDNNKVENLQLVTHRENTSKDKKGTSKYRGV